MKQHPRYDELLIKLKTLVPNSLNNAGYDAVVDYALDKTINDVANYVHIPILELPEELDTTIISMCYQLMFTHELLAPVDQQTSGVKSIAEGDTTVHFMTPSDVFVGLQQVNSVTDNYVAQLNTFRKVKR